MNLVIPYTNQRYFINSDGVVFDTLTETHTGRDLKRFHILFVFCKEPLQVDISFLILLAFRPLFKLDELILNWQVGFTDNNADNISLDNLYWILPANKQECPEKPGWYIPAGYTKYAVNDQGEVWSRFSSLFIKKNFDRDGYYRTSSTNLDNGVCFKQTRARVCRLVALAFHKPFTNPILIQVNHKDSNRSNDTPSNLEWCTPRQNQMHAIQQGLAPVVNVVIKDLVDKKIYFLNTIIDAARFVKKYPAYMKWYIDNNIKSVINDRYEVVATGDLEDYADNAIYKIYDEDCVAFNIQTEEIVICSNPQELKEYTGLDRETVRNKLFYINPWPVKNWCFMWADEYFKGTKFRKFSNAEKAFFLNKPGIKNPVYITDTETNEIQYLESNTKAGEILGINKMVLCGKYDGSIIKGQDGRNYKIQKLI